MEIYFLAVLLGVIVGIVASFFGIGGGVLFVPILILVFNYDTKMAIGTSLLAVFITSISSALAYARRERINYKLGLMLESASIPGAILGAYIVTIVSVILLRKIFSVFLLLLSANLMIEKMQHNKQRTKQKSEQYTKNRLIQAEILSFLAGMLSAMLGIGGGVLKVPVMLLVLDLPIHQATATSSFMIVITSFVGLTQHTIHGYVDFIFGSLLGIGATFGAQIGVKLSDYTKPRVLRRLFAVMLTLIAIELLVK